MESSPGKLLGLQASRPHMEPGALCPTAAPLAERLFRVLVGVTGSVAALKLPLLVSRLMDIPGTCVIRAWDRRKPLLFCPAMNTTMWEHPITSQQVGQLQAFGYIEIPCVAKMLVCGDQEWTTVTLMECFCFLPLYILLLLPEGSSLSG
ncbi:phosphopantothenoylcysteine decarboxylase isoform 3-T5 [Rhynchonycteris naso]